MPSSPVLEEEKAALRSFLLANVFKVNDGSEVLDEEVAAVFGAFDSDGNGSVTSDEFRQAAIMLGCEPSSEELELLIRMFDMNGDGNVSYLEFLTFVKGEEQVTQEAREGLRQYMLANVFQVSNGSEVSEEQVQAIFGAFDTDGSGDVTTDEFREAAIKLGFDPSSEELELLISIFDFDGDGTVTFAEFVCFVRGDAETEDPGESTEILEDDIIALKEFMLKEIFQTDTPEEVTEQDVKNMFKNMDTNNDGVIDIKEFKAAIIEAGFDPDSEELQTCVRLFDSNRDGSIDYQEFLQFVRNNKNTKAYKRTVTADQKLFKSGRRRLSRSQGSVRKAYRMSMSEGQVRKEGRLQKKSTGLRRGWQTKYYVCTSHYLKCFEDDTKGNLRGMLDLHDVTQAEKKDKVISLTTFHKEILQYRLDDEEEAESWYELLDSIASKDLDTKLDPILTNTKGHKEMKAEITTFYQKHQPKDVDKVDTVVKKAFFDRL